VNICITLAQLFHSKIVKTVVHTLADLTGYAI